MFDDSIESALERQSVWTWVGAVGLNALPVDSAFGHAAGFGGVVGLRCRLWETSRRLCWRMCGVLRAACSTSSFCGFPAERYSSTRSGTREASPDEGCRSCSVLEENQHRKFGIGKRRRGGRP